MHCAIERGVQTGWERSKRLRDIYKVNLLQVGRKGDGKHGHLQVGVVRETCV